MKPIIYLASPYSHPDPVVRMHRAALVSQVAFKLMLQGLCIYCPIAETVMIALSGDTTKTGWDFWRDQDLPKLNACSEMYICDMDGWRNSTGIKGEVKFMLNNNKKVALVNPETLIALELFEYDLLHFFDLNSLDELND